MEKNIFLAGLPQMRAYIRSESDDQEIADEVLILNAYRHGWSLIIGFKNIYPESIVPIEDAKFSATHIVETSTTLRDRTHTTIMKHELKIRRTTVTET